MKFSLLGPLEVTDGEREITVGGGRRRALLALLLLHANEVVSAERLIDELWGERPTATATKSLHVYVSQLRKELASANGSLLLTRGNGYSMEVDADQLDLLRFERLVDDGRRAFEEGRADRSAQKLRDALALWRGPPLSDFQYEPFAQHHIARLDEERLTALEARIEADLTCGRHAEIVGELEDLVVHHPLREHLRAQLMLALYRCGRQADALESYRAGRTRLSEDLGLEPGPELRALEAAILAHSAELAAPAAPRATPARERAAASRPSRRRLALIAVSAAVLLAAAALAALVEDEPGSAARAAPRLDIARNSIAVVSPRDGAASAMWPLYGRPTDLAADGDGAWAVTVDTAALTRVDARTGTITRSLPLSVTPGAVAVGEGAVWVADGRAGTLVRVVPGYDEMSEITFRRGRPPERAGPDATAVAAGEGGVWVTDGSENLVRVDPQTRGRTAIDVGMPLNGVTVGAGAVWVISGRTGNVLRIDPATNRVTDSIAIAERPGEDAPVPASIAASEGAVWVLNRNTATVVRIDPTGRGISGTVPIGVDRVPNEIVAAGRTAWVANEDGTLSRIDEKAREARSVWVGESLRQAATNGARLWVGTASLDQQLPGGVG